MSVLMTMRMHGRSEDLEKVAVDDPAKLRSISDYAEGHGLISHQFWGTDGDIMVVDEWETQEAFEQFRQAEDSEIRDVMGASGVTDQPEVTYWRRLDTPDIVPHPTEQTLRRASFDEPEETRPFTEGKGRMDLLSAGGGLVGRAVFEPGWRWSSHVKPIAGTDSCQAAHMGYVVSGRMVVRMDDGAETEVGPGDLMTAPPGHDAWVVGDEACVIVDWQGVADYAKH